MTASAARDQQALDLRRAGFPITKIMEHCGFRTRDAASNAIDRAMRAQGIPANPLTLRELELDRLDRLHFAVWKKAVKGDAAAVDRVLAITEMRLRIAGIQEAGLTPITDSYDKTIDQLDLQDIDAAAVALGRRYCEQVDAASGLGDPVAVIKALHLMPHVMNVLDKLGATPSARGAVKQSAPKPSGKDATVTGLAAFMAENGGSKAS